MRLWHERRLWVLQGLRDERRLRVLQGLRDEHRLRVLRGLRDERRLRAQDLKQIFGCSAHARASAVKN